MQALAMHHPKLSQPFAHLISKQKVQSSVFDQMNLEPVQEEVEWVQDELEYVVEETADVVYEIEDSIQSIVFILLEYLTKLPFYN